MADGSRIPLTISEFNNYINNTNTYLHAGSPQNGIRLGLVAGDLTEWDTRTVYWHDTLFPLYTNELTSSSSVKDNVRIFMKDFREFAQPRIDIMAVDPDATQDDANVLHFVLQRAKPSKPTENIKGKCFASISAIGGGSFDISCRTINDSSRPSKPDGADCVMISFRIVSDGKMLPAGPDDGMTKVVNTKAKFQFDTDPANRGKYLQVYFRWYNTRYPQFAGTWNEAQSVLIN